MYKKAGIIVSIVFIVLAVVIYWTVANLDKEDKAEPKVETPSKPKVMTEPTTVKQTTTTTEKVVEKSEPNQKEVTVETKPVKQELTKIPADSKKVFSELAESDLGDPEANRTEVMVVSKKKVMVLDTKYGTKEGKQLVFAVDLLYGDDTMSFTMNKVAYDDLSVGDKLKVDYSLYKNDKGVVFPAIVSVVKAD